MSELSNMNARRDQIASQIIYVNLMLYETRKKLKCLKLTYIDQLNSVVNQHVQSHFNIVQLLREHLWFCIVLADFFTWNNLDKFNQADAIFKSRSQVVNGFIGMGFSDVLTNPIRERCLLNIYPVALIWPTGDGVVGIERALPHFVDVVEMKFVIGISQTLLVSRVAVLKL